jgi:transposase, IS30 family
MPTYKRLTYEDRCQIHGLIKQGISQTETSRALGFNQSSISRELQRNSGRRGYRFKGAQSKAQARQLVRCKRS